MPSQVELTSSDAEIEQIFKSADQCDEKMTHGSPHSSEGGSRKSSAGMRNERLDAVFTPPLTKSFKCPLCSNLLLKPMRFPECGHRVCQGCLKNCTRGEPRCPVDQEKFDPKAVEYDRSFQTEIDNLEVKCNNHEWGCTWVAEYKTLLDHLDTCDYAEVLCASDCGAKFQRRFQQKHSDKDCPKKIIACAYCDERHLREDKKEHFLDCPKLPCPCPNKCDKKLVIPRDELDPHVENDCPRTKMNCNYESLGCTHRCNREKLAKHYKTSIIDHVRLVYEMLQTQQKTLDDHEEKLGDQIKLIDKQEKRISDLERIAHSQIIWRIEDYSRKLKEAKSGNCTTLFSPTFTTSKHGYRLCASVCLNGDGKGKGTHISVFISVLKGAFDALLKWPFDYRVTFYLLDQCSNPDERKHIRFSIKPNPCPDNEPFLGRPKMEKNASFGGAKFVKHEEIVEDRMVKDDTIFLKICVDCDGNSEP